jgi:parallel beta-helix repeat protein
VTPSHPTISNSTFYLAPTGNGASVALSAETGLPQPNPDMAFATYTLRAFQIRASDDPAFVPLAPDGGVPPIAVTVAASTPEVIETAPGVSAFDPAGPPISSGGTGVPVKLGFVTQPTSTSPGSIVAPPIQVAVQDGVGAVITEPARMVTIAIGTNAGGGTLLGTLTVQAVGGIATFPDLAITSAGNGYTLLATSSGVDGATSEPFDVSSAAAVDLVLRQGLASVLNVPIPDSPGHIAINPITGIAYVVAHTFDGPNPRVVAVDTAINAIVAQYVVGPNPTALAVNPTTNRVYVTSKSSSNTVWEIDAAAGVVTPIALNPVHVMTLDVAVDPVRDRIYFTLAGGGVTVVDGASRSEVDSFSLPNIGGASSGSIRVNPIANKVYVARGTTFTVIDVDSGTWLDVAMPSGENVTGIAINARTNKVYVAGQLQTGPQRLYKFDGATDTALSLTEVDANASVAVDEDRDFVYAKSAVSAAINVFAGNLEGITEGSPVPGARTLTVDPRNGRLYTQDQLAATMTVVIPPMSLPEVHAAPGATVTVRGALAQNRGGTTSPPTFIDFTLSSVDPSGFAQVHHVPLPALAPFEGRLIEPTFTISSDFPPGDYLMTVKVDPDDAVGESDESNNVVEVPVRLRSAGQPDLVVTSLTHSPASPSVHETVTATVVVSNLGVAPAPATVMRLKLEDDETFQSATTLVNVPPMAPGAEFTFTRAVVAVTSGTVSHVANVDYTGVVSESNEGNNRTENTFTVTSDGFLFVFSPADSGLGSLRQAITEANAVPGKQVIVFVDEVPGIKTITPLTPLPTITEAVVIDGTTQPGYTPGNPHVRISGVSAGGAAHGLVVNNTSGVTIRGLSITSFAQSGIFLSGTGGNHVLEGNFIGLAPDGNTASGNNEGVLVAVSSNNKIGGLLPAMGNVISGNLAAGINLSTGANQNAIFGNFIGINATGTAAVGNPVGVAVTSNAADNRIGDASTTALNIISGNTVGIRVQTTGTGNLIQRNYIGTDRLALVSLGNTEHGVLIRESSGTYVGRMAGPTPGANLISGNGIGVQIDGATSNGNVVQGNAIGLNRLITAALPNTGSGVVVQQASDTTIDTNIISGNGQHGIWVLGLAVGTSIVGNTIGTNGNHATGLGNGLEGILLQSGTRVGGEAPSAGNVISGNTQNGIRIFTSGSVVRGNFIGTAPNGASNVGNGEWGILLDTGAENNTISGLDAAGEFQNVIAFNAEGGIGLTTDAGNGNWLRVNRIFNNGGLAIDIGRDGVTFNDSLDSDTGANNRQNFPFITSASSDGSSTSINGQLHSTPNTTFRIDFFTNTVCDPSGFGEAQSWLGNILSVTTNGAGDAAFSASFDVGVAGGSFVTASATSFSRDTSELSDCRMVSGSAGPSIGVTNTNNSGVGSLRQAILDANTAPGIDTITFAIPGAGPYTIPVMTPPLPGITDPVIIDGTSQSGYAGSPLIVLDGTGAGSAVGLLIEGGFSRIAGLSIVRFEGSAIVLKSNGNLVHGNYLGVLPDGVSAAPNHVGIFIDGGDNNLIGGTSGEERNVVSGNISNAIHLVFGASNNVITGNYIGTTADGNAALGNVGTGVYISGQHNRVGGQSSGEGNVISGNSSGVSVENGEDTSIVGNLIGVDAAGINAVGNAAAVNITAGSVGTLVRANVMSGNFGNGLSLSGLSNNSIVQGNFIGTRADGATILPNQVNGISISDSFSNLIGGKVPTGTGGQNVIAGNAFTGVDITSFGGTGNYIRFNSIFANGILGIDINSDGVTPNDAGDTDSGSNDGQNFPVLDSVTSAAGVTTVTGSLNSTPATTFSFDLYSNDLCDSSGHGEGETWFGFLTGTTDASGNLTFTRNLAATLAPGLAVTATATSPSSNTSEFSACRTVETPAAPPILVTNANNSGAGSLRQAILDANGTAGTDTITFNIPVPGVATINLLSPLPIVTDPAFIDGTSQPGYAGTPLIVLNGSAAGAGDGLAITAGNSRVRGLSIVGFGVDGSAIALNGSSGSIVQANYLGILPDGTTALPNVDGVSILDSSYNTVGGTTAEDRNVISGNSGSGVKIINDLSEGNVVQGNYIGTDANGTAAVPNQGVQSGVFLLGATYTQIGGPGAARNVISGNAHHAVTVVGPEAYENRVHGNYIGVDSTGLTELGNGGIGVDVVEAVNTTIGGNARNIISGNAVGIQIRTGAAAVNVFANYIGTDVVGGSVPNANDGIYVHDGVLGAIISDNLIANNGGNGVTIEDSSRAAIFHNRFAANGGLAIDLGNDGVTDNDDGDVDDGPNHLQNYPVIESVSTIDSITTVTGTLNSTPNTSFTIQLFSSAGCDPSGHGEGETTLRTITQSTDAAGNLVFAASFSDFPSGMAFTATATTVPASATSEFSACVVPAF